MYVHLLLKHVGDGHHKEPSLFVCHNALVTVQASGLASFVHPGSSQCFNNMIIFPIRGKRRTVGCQHCDFEFCWRQHFLLTVSRSQWATSSGSCPRSAANDPVSLEYGLQPPWPNRSFREETAWQIFLSLAMRVYP